jgi:hypothetical protein
LLPVLCTLDPPLGLLPKCTPKYIIGKDEGGVSDFFKECNLLVTEGCMQNFITLGQSLL